MVTVKIAGTGLKWTVERRYKEFYKLNSALKKQLVEIKVRV